jgi:putative ABC transport system ATP-binding protein
MNPPTAISARHVTRVYGRGDVAFRALDGIDLSIVTAESVAIVGKSGSGKSTLMHILALLDQPTSGSVIVGDRDASQLGGKQIDRLRNESFGFVFQQFFLNGNDAVLANVTLPLKIAGVARKARKVRGLEALASVELADKADSKAADLSGGQKQRVCIARALINEPSIIFADEPTGNLDSHTGKNVEDLLLRLNHEQGITLVVVTHDEDFARRCERRLRIKDGALADGSAT